LTRPTSSPTGSSSSSAGGSSRSTEELRRQIAGEDEVRWVRAGQRFRRCTADSTSFVRNLFATDAEAISELEVRRASLEDTYLTLVRQAEDSHEDSHGVAAASSSRGAA
jgi:ABC-2 type transport system ATP-binding protein